MASIVLRSTACGRVHVFDFGLHTCPPLKKKKEDVRQTVEIRPGPNEEILSENII